MCYKPTRFRLLCASPVEFFRPGLELLNRDNVGLVLLLQPLVPEGLGQVSVAPLCVANTHVLYNPRRGDVKLAQMAILLAEVDKVARLSDGSHCPIILCGDLNSVPDSPLYNFIRDGELQYNGMPAWKVKWATTGVGTWMREGMGAGIKCCFGGSRLWLLVWKSSVCSWRLAAHKYLQHIEHLPVCIIFNVQVILINCLRIKTRNKRKYPFIVQIPYHPCSGK